MDVVKRGVPIGSIVKLGNASSGISAQRKLNGSLTLPTTIRVVGKLQMVFTNLIMTTQVNKIVNQPPMNSMVLEGTNVQMQRI
jgi:hypothetical protein